jgi:predicted RNA polymerase sigma factor
VAESPLQVAIAAVRDQAADHAETDWLHIAALYGLLERMTHNSMVALNQAVAAAMAEGLAAGLGAPLASDVPNWGG